MQFLLRPVAVELLSIWWCWGPAHGFSIRECSVHIIKGIYFMNHMLSQVHNWSAAVPLLLAIWVSVAFGPIVFVYMVVHRCFVYMFDFQLKDHKNIFELKVIINFFLNKHTFGPNILLDPTFTTKNQTYIISVTIEGLCIISLSIRSQKQFYWFSIFTPYLLINWFQFPI